MDYGTKGFSFCYFCFHALHCKLQGGFHAQFSLIQGSKQNETRTRSHKLRTRSPNTLTYPQIGQANQAKQSKPSSMCTRDHLQKQCSFPQIRATLKPKSKTMKMLCVLNTVYTYVDIYIYSYSILFIFFRKTKKCTSLTAFPHLNASWSDLPLSLFQANF